MRLIRENCQGACVCAPPLSRVRLFATPWTIALRLLYPWAFPGKNTGCCEVTQSCPTLRNPVDYSPQAPLSMELSRQEYWLLRSHFSRVQLFATPWTAAHQTPLSVGFSRQEYWSGLPFPPPGGLPDPGIKAVSPLSPAMAGEFFTTEPLGKLIRVLQRSKIVRP